jgi:uncharacterized repeat protein (TIGR01451 family)
MRRFIISFFGLIFSISFVYAEYTWTNYTSQGLNRGPCYSVYVDGSNIYVGQDTNEGAWGGLYISTDSGNTWTRKTTAHGLGGNSCRAVYASGNKVYVATSGGLSISNDGGNSFTNKTMVNGLGDNNCRGLYGSGSSLYAATSGGLSISTDGGATWTNKMITNGLGNNNCMSVYAFGNMVYVTTSGGIPSGLSISNDGGNSFTSKVVDADGLGVYASGSNIYVATTGGLLISTDNGTTWVNKTTTNGLGHNYCMGVYASGNNVYVATYGGLSISTDGGDTFINKTGSDGLGAYDSCLGVFASGNNIYATTSGGLSVATSGPLPSAAPIVFVHNAPDATLTNQDTNSNPISVMRMNENVLGVGSISQAMLNDVVMTSNGTGAKITIPSTNQIAATVNASGGVASVHVIFYNAPNARIFINGKQATTLGGTLFPAYAGYLRNVVYTAGTKALEFDITHFTEYGIKYLTAEPFTGTGGAAVIAAPGSTILVTYNGGSVAGAVTQDVNISVLSIHGLAYETLSADLGVSGNLYTPVVPGQPYGFSFEYINRGNMTDTYGVLPTIETTGGHFVAEVAAPSIVVAPWQVAYADVKVSANNTTVSYERATLNVSIYIDNPVWDNAEDLVASYNAFNGAYVGGTYADEGIYGGLGDSAMNYTFVLLAEGYTVKVLSRTVTVNAPNGTAQLLPGAKIKYDITVQNLGGSIATSVNIKDLIPANCHLYYTDAPTVVGTTEWAWLGATDNAATNATTDAVKYEITIPALTTVTASYTVTLD